MTSAVRTGYAAALWSIVFGVFHIYWAFGGDLGFGDGKAAHDDMSAGFLIYDLVVAVLCVVGAAVAVALVRPAWRGFAPEWTLTAAGWTVPILLLLRGGLSFIDLGLSNEDVYGEPNPSDFTVWSLRTVDFYFIIGGILFAVALWYYLRSRRQASTTVPR